MASFPHLPVTDFPGVTRNFETLLPLLNASEEPAKRRSGSGESTGPWSALEAVSASLKAVAGAETPGVRMEASGTRVFLRGVYEATAEITAGAIVFKVPAAVRAKAEVFPSGTVYTSAANVATRWRIKTNGEVELNVTVKSTGNLFLDGLSWNLT